MGRRTNVIDDLELYLGRPLAELDKEIDYRRVRLQTARSSMMQKLVGKRIHALEAVRARHPEIIGD
jgi:hypothetical protein